MNIRRAAGKDKRVEIANPFGKLGGGKAQRDFDGVGAGGFSCSEILVVGFPFVLKFFFSSAIRDAYTHLRAGFGGHGRLILPFGLQAGNCGENATKMRRNCWAGEISITAQVSAETEFQLNARDASTRAGRRRGIRSRWQKWRRLDWRESARVPERPQDREQLRLSWRDGRSSLQARARKWRGVGG